MAFGGIEILARLSTGGMGEVLLGRRHRDLGFEKLCAVKTIRGDLASREDFRIMFLDEARLVARLDHPTICQVYDFGEEGKTLFLAMEYVAGVPLAQLLKAGRAPFPAPVAAMMIAEVLRGLHHAHEATDTSGHHMGVVHRDVSPQNMILTFDGRMKILDFGIALTKDRESPETAVGVLKGKPSYMAPEHLRGAPVDRRADIFSSAVVLHELLTGQKLFTRETALATALAVESDPIAPPSSFVPGIPADLDAIVMRGLTRSPDERYADARSMAEALEKAMGNLQAGEVEEFARVELQAEAEAHQRWLIEVLDRAERGAEFDLEPTSPGSVVEGELPGPPPEVQPSDVRRGSWAPPGPRRSSQAPVDPAQPRRASFGAPPREVSLRGRPSGAPPSADPQRETSRRPPIALWLTAAALVGVLALVFAFGSSGPVSAPLPPSELVEASPVPSAEPPVDPSPSPISPPPPSPVPSPSASLAPIATPSPTRRPRLPREGETVEPRPGRAEAGHGFLTIGATPYANVRIDGADVGVTPIMRKRVPAGSHHVELVSPENGEIRLKKTVNLEADEHQRITLP